MDCQIRPWRTEDAGGLAAALNNRRVQDNLRDGPPYPYTVADAEAYIAAMLAAEEGTAYAFAITVDGAAVGSIAAFRKENIHFRTAELGYYLAEPYWGKGIGSKAVRQICDDLFAHTDILRIFAAPFVHNAASCRILEKAGFSCEGTLRKNAVKNGEIRDMKLYALVREC